MGNPKVETKAFIDIATACSGTDIAVQTLQHFCKLCNDMFLLDIPIAVNHLWSCDVGVL